jgi:hypothetical protein
MYWNQRLQPQTMLGKIAHCLSFMFSWASHVNCHSVQVDVVAVPGINAHPLKNWEKDGYSWIQDLRIDFPQTRIMVFGYKARFFGRTRLRHFALQLLIDLRNQRRDVSICIPIVQHQYHNHATACGKANHIHLSQHWWAGGQRGECAVHIVEDFE